MATDLELNEATSTDPQRWRWTRDEYHRLHEAGFFQDQQVELLDGDILAMNAQGPRPEVNRLCRSGIPEYWVVDLVDNQLHVYRAPGLSGYAQPKTLSLDQSIQLFAIPQAKLNVAELFPRQRRQR